MKFSVQTKSAGSRARAGIIETPHGIIETPAFIPVATKATVKALTPEQIRDDVGAQAVLANTYHLYLQPGTEVLRKAGGLGKFMNWSGPTFTDSGGFQAFSLGGSGKNRKSKIETDKAKASVIETPRDWEDRESIPMAAVSEDGVAFKSIIDESSHMFTPERSIEIQDAIGADLIFAFDECLLPAETYERQKEAVERTTRWAERCLRRHKELQASSSLLGIVQGGRHEDLRRLSARQISSMDFDGFGIGGSFDKEDIGTAVGWVCDELPEGKPRHLLGIGSEPEDLILGIENGVDTFDCVAPTRIARNGTAYIRAELSGAQKSTISLMNAQFVDDHSPLDHSCKCYTCAHYTRAYLSHLFRSKEMLAATLVSIHNLYFVVNLVKRAREAILAGEFSAWSSRMLGR